MAAPVRWGILGTATIARKNWKAIRLAGSAALIAVGSRDAAKAQKFIDECQAEASFPTPPVPCSYDELLARKDIDAVYIPLPTGIRREWVVKAADAGKHILCEKPCGLDADQVEAMLAACRSNKVLFMDGVMFMHSRRLPLLVQVLSDRDAIGDVRRITSHFSFNAPDEFLQSNIRVSSTLEPLGCLGDLGWYNIRLALCVMNFILPDRVTGRILADTGGDRPVPLEFSGELFFPGGVSSSFYCSFRTEHQQWASIGGTKGSILIPDFVLPYYGCESSLEVSQPVFRVEGTSFHMERHVRRHAVAEYSDGTADSQETNMIRRFSELVATRTIDETWGEIALKTQKLLDACLRSARNEGKEEMV